MNGIIQSDYEPTKFAAPRMANVIAVRYVLFERLQRGMRSRISDVEKKGVTPILSGMITNHLPVQTVVK